MLADTSPETSADGVASIPDSRAQLDQVEWSLAFRMQRRGTPSRRGPAIGARAIHRRRIGEDPTGHRLAIGLAPNILTQGGPQAAEAGKAWDPRRRARAVFLEM